MKNLLCLAFLCSVFTLPSSAWGQNSAGWKVELNRLAFNFTSTEVSYAQEYQDFPDARLTADSQTSISGELSALGDYYSNNWVWTNQLQLDYGKTRIRPVEGETLTNENADKIAFTTGYTQRLWRVDNWMGGFEAGPFATLGYETEFTRLENSPRRKIYRGTLGVKIFDGVLLKDLYAAVVGEADHTYDPASQKLAWEAGLKLQTQLREGVNAEFTAKWRNYLHESTRQSTDLDYELELDGRLNVAVYKNLSVAPFINFYTAQGKYIGPRGQNVYVGVALSFSHIFMQPQKPE